MHVLVVDDEVRLAALVAEYLVSVGFSAEVSHDGLSAMERIRGGSLDAVVLDRMLPGMSGEDVCRTLRAEHNSIPILMLTARGSVSERVDGLEAGADDYMVKPFAMEELVARLNALLRRVEVLDEDRLVLGDVVLDLSTRRLWVAGVEVATSRREFAMLTALMERAGRVVGRHVLFDEVWDEEVDINSNALDVYISRVRTRLAGSDRVSVATLRGVGYRIDCRSADDA
ncbi:MAG TPA: response regulator transcription factor [Marmoricola sp.]|nr:response regulator transcription factor [Marmoricola sp.]